MAQIKGKVSRVVSEEGNLPSRVFFRLEDPGALRDIDGSKRAGFDEVVVKDQDAAGGAAGFSVGEEVEYDVDTGKLSAA